MKLIFFQYFTIISSFSSFVKELEFLVKFWKKTSFF